MTSKQVWHRMRPDSLIESWSGWRLSAIVPIGRIEHLGGVILGDFMLRVFVLSLVVLCGIGAQNAGAADMGPGGGFCLRLAPSSVLDTGDARKITAQVDQWYSHAVEISQSQPVVASARSAYVWASEAKAYCGMAKGFLSAGEIDAETVSKCDCFHGRMVHFLR